MAVPAFRAAGALIHGLNGVTPAAPAGLATDDVELLLVETMDEAVTLTTANGFVEVAGSPVSVPSGTATVATRLTAFWRRWDGVAGDPVVTDSGNHNVAQRIAFSGCIATGNPWDITVASSEAVEDTTGSATGGTTTVVDTLAVLCVGTAKPDTLSTTVFSDWANADLATVTERVDNAGNSGNGGALGMATGEKATAGAFGAMTYTSSVSTYKAHLVVALKPPAGGTNFPLVASPGSIAVTGTIASPLADRQVAASPGSVAVTGVVASPLAARQVTASAGSFALTGVVASLLADRQVAASPGSVAVTGTAASALVDRVVSAELGMYALSGFVAGLLADRGLSASPGSYALTGVLAELGLGAFALNAEVGIYGVSGVGASILAARLLAADPGVFLLADSAADLLVAAVDRHGFSSGFKPRPGARRDLFQEGKW